MDTKTLRDEFVREHNRWVRSRNRTQVMEPFVLDELPKRLEPIRPPKPKKIKISRGKFPHHGLENGQRLALLASHSGLCELCGRPSDLTLHVDHCHETGKIRGILCSGCNGGLGFFSDSIEKLKLAIAYLEKHQ